MGIPDGKGWIHEADPVTPEKPWRCIDHIRTAGITPAITSILQPDFARSLYIPEPDRWFLLPDELRLLIGIDSTAMWREIDQIDTPDGPVRVESWYRAGGYEVLHEPYQPPRLWGRQGMSIGKAGVIVDYPGQPRQFGTWEWPGIDGQYHPIAGRELSVTTVPEPTGMRGWLLWLFAYSWKRSRRPDRPPVSEDRITRQKLLDYGFFVTKERAYSLTYPLLTSSTGPSYEIHVHRLPWYDSNWTVEIRDDESAVCVAYPASMKDVQSLMLVGHDPFYLEREKGSLCGTPMLKIS